MNRTWSHLQRSSCTKLIFNVNSRRVTPRQSLDSNTAFFFISSDSILISTHPKQNLQIQDKIIYALLSSVSSEKSFTFYQNPRCLSKEYSWTSEITAKTELLKHWLYQEKSLKEGKRLSLHRLCHLLNKESNTFYFHRPSLISCFRVGWLVRALAFRSLAQMFTWPRLTSPQKLKIILHIGQSWSLCG